MNKTKDYTESAAQEKLEPYNAQINRYLAKKSTATTRLAASGAILFVDEKTRRVDKFSDHIISPYNQPADPDHVDSVVLHTCDYVEVNTYTNGSKALQHTCNFTVVNVSTGAWSNWGEFKGSMPASEIKRKRGSTSDERGGKASDAFFAAGGLVTRRTAPQ
ncbi:MAG: hypothetical protein EOO38_28690 [Cytophagaceae bacterium]|nr:MAG: hypothetical protein EOO38_28690 [Cytophagaceae bacterium]